MDTSNIFEQEWIKFFEISYDGIIIADGKGYIIYMNPASERLEEVKKENIIGKHAKDLESKGIYEQSVTLRILKSKKPITVMQNKGNKQLIITGIPIYENREIKWIFVNERDITELNKIKKEMGK